MGVRLKTDELNRLKKWFETLCSEGLYNSDDTKLIEKIEAEIKKRETASRSK